MEALVAREAAAAMPTSPDNFNSDSPRKKRKYVPGGPGGGGRFVATEKPVTRSRSPDAPVRRSRHPLATPAPAARPRRERTQDNKPTFDSAADAAAAATVQIDGYKPREERGWEEFHPDLNIEVKIAAFSANEVDGVASVKLELSQSNSSQPEPSDGTGYETGPGQSGAVPPPSTVKRRPGRPFRNPGTMLTGLGSPPAPKIVPIPTHNPRERLTLPKPSYKKIDPFAAYEADQNVQVNFVDKSLAHVGYQEGDIFARPGKTFIRLVENVMEDEDNVELVLEGDGEEALAAAPMPAVGVVEYDMDEQDNQWLDALNVYRKSEDVEAVKPAIFEITMTQIEKEWHALEKRIPKPNPKPPQTHRPRSGSAAAVNGEPAAAGEEQDSKCAICDDGDCENTNAIVFCDGCDLAVHQECYGVPFIPEGQWLCRKCQLVGRNTPTCIFCPNTDGAFKLTSESRWSHLLCAIWIPEVSLGNTTFMEPVMDVAKVPKQRWKLSCYICNQKMGACIQCGNRNCFQAFHVTCARRAKLFLKMKSSHGTIGNIDASVLKALCDKHVPSEWRREHNTDEATAEAKTFYQHAMRGRKWADSQQAALALVASQPLEVVDTIEDPIRQDDSQPSTAAQRRKRQQAQKNVWRLPSGAPIVPVVVFNAVEAAMQRFAIRKRKEYVAEACKYWTLKREARRGAALLKRLQLQMKTFTSSEITRRDFAAMGSAGQPRLERRITFVDQMLTQMAQVKEICEHVKQLQELKLQDVELLRTEIDTVYTPLAPLIRPILEKAQSLDPRGIFYEGLGHVRRKLDHRFYASMQAFANDLGACFRSVVGLEQVTDVIQAHERLVDTSLKEIGLSMEQKEMKKLAKRIVKAVQQPLNEALLKEAALTGKPYDNSRFERLVALLNHNDGRNPVELSTDVGRLEITSESTTQSQAESINMDIVENTRSDGVNESITPRESPETLPLRGSIKRPSVSIDSEFKDSANTWVSPESMTDLLESRSSMLEPNESSGNFQAQSFDRSASGVGGNPAFDSVMPSAERVDLPTSTALMTPPSSEKSVAHPEVGQGGIPWYLEPFDPVGTTINEERWTGREVLREMSEELSEMDEDELRGMGVEIDDEKPAADALDEAAVARVEAAKKAAAAKRRKLRNRW